MSTTHQDVFDPAPYVRPPVLSIATGLPLVARLLNALRPDDPPPVRAAGAEMRAVAVAAQQAWAERLRRAGSVATSDKRAIDNAADVAWRALYDRLAAYASLPVSIAPRAEQASALLASLFGATGLGFLAARYEAQFAQCDTLLLRIRDEKLAADIDAFAGAEFLAAVHAAHGPYAAMVKGKKGGDEPLDDIDLREHLLGLGEAIAAYGIQVVATVKKTKAPTVTAARRLLAPLDTHRAGQNTTKAKGSDGSTPAAPTDPVTTPLPEVPGAPVGTTA